MVKISKVFDILQGNMLKVLGWLSFTLETTAANVSPERDGEDEKDGEDLDDPRNST